MMKPVYILSSSAISPQHSFEPENFLHPVKSTDDGKLFVVDPDYRQFINPVAIRRMSRLIKMGIAAGMNALKLAGLEKPDAIITGTGLGSMTDMEHFLKDMINMNEEALNPTFFIQSTYNSVNGWIAVQSKCTSYNQTYVNRGFSLELSLLDAQLLLNEATEREVALVGCFDELTDEYFIVKNKIGYWKKQLPQSRHLLKESNTVGTIAGEGTSFFTLSNKAENSVCILHGVKMIQSPTSAEISANISTFLQQHHVALQDIDLIITGMNGDTNFQPLYQAALEHTQPHTTIAAFKHLSGEYPTASGFALWLSAQLFSTQTIPEEIIYKRGATTDIRKILIINHYILNTASLMLLSN
ncbi:MAG TPA: beta-ketoacyl synthase chain length factor [Flavipsychrobacter sp.]|nr:beta-ketoacyl synthase chain length factor [Flavipsychrobacter sp.]